MKRIFCVVVMLIFALGMVFAAGESEAKTEEGAELEFWDMLWGPSETYLPTMKAMAKAYTDETGVPVKYQSIAWDAWYQTFLTAVTSKAAPDIATTAFPLPIQFAAMGETLYLDSIMEEWKAEGNPILTDIDPGRWDIYKWEGHQAAMPWDIQPSSLMYRKDIFEELNIEIPTTWEEFVDACRVIKKEKPDIAPALLQAGDHVSYHVMMAFLFQNGVGFLTADRKPNLLSPAAQHTMKFFGQMLEEGLVPSGVVSYRSSDAQKIYYSGNAAILFGYGLPAFVKTDYPEIYNNTGTMPVLKGPDTNDPKMMGWYNPIMGFKQTKYPEASKQFIKWYMDNYLPIYQEGGRASFPSRNSWRELDFWNDFPMLKEQSEMLVDRVVTPPWPAPSLYVAYPQIEGEIYPGLALQRIFSGETDYEKIGKEINARIQKALDESE